jgi:hypothetical protein
VEEEALDIVVVATGLTWTAVMVLAAVTIVDGSGEVVARRWRFPSLAAPPLDRLGFVGWSGGGDEPRTVCRPGLHPFYMAQCDGGPPAIGLGAPDQGAGQAPLEPLGSSGGRSI